MTGGTHTAGGLTINADVVNIGGDVVGRDITASTQAAPAPPVEPELVFRLLVIVSRPLDVNELPAIADQWRLVQSLQTVNAPVAVKVLRPPKFQEAWQRESQSSAKAQRKAKRKV